jgi:hypothetical protein
MYTVHRLRTVRSGLIDEEIYLQTEQVIVLRNVLTHATYSKEQVNERGSRTRMC